MQSYHVNLDKLEVRVEFPREKFNDKISEIEKLRGQIGDAIQRTINLAVTVTLAEPNSLPAVRKNQAVTDLRNK